jgi:DNA-binding Xre family transcriptional regulator
MTTKPKEIRWRLRVMMAERDIRTVTDLGRRLRDIGLEISSQQLARVVNEMPQRMNTDLLAGLITVLDCTPSDLMEVREPDDEPSGKAKEATRYAPEPKPQRTSMPKRRPSRSPRPSRPLGMDDDITGPVVSPFPLTGHV